MKSNSQQITIPKGKILILFDGVCNLCNGAVNFIIKRDKNNIFLFAALQEEVGKHMIRKYRVDTSKVDSILTLSSTTQNLEFKSDAALSISKHLGFPYSLLPVFKIVPKFLRDGVYDIIAKNRYRWFGKQEVCMIPTPELKSKFL